MVIVVTTTMYEKKVERQTDRQTDGDGGDDTMKTRTIDRHMVMIW